MSPTEHSSALFVGDSVLQHYVVPMKDALGLNTEEIDTVTRGGCVLLKGANFVDKFSDISCNDIRGKLYKNEKTYDYVVISQAWDSYNSSVLNFSSNVDGYEKWLTLLNDTVEHFLQFSDKVIIIGAHPSVEGTLNLQPSITVTRESFSSNLRNLKLTNRSQLEDSRHFFARYKDNERIMIIEPYQIFCNKVCIFSDDNWSYYSDSQHISSASTAFVKKRILELMHM